MQKCCIFDSVKQPKANDMTTQAPTYYTEKKRITTVYSRFNTTEKIEGVEMVNLGCASMSLESLKWHMFNERIGDWMLLRKTKSIKKVKEQIENNLEAIIKSL